MNTIFKPATISECENRSKQHSKMITLDHINECNTNNSIIPCFQIDSFNDKLWKKLKRDCSYTFRKPLFKLQTLFDKVENTLEQDYCNNNFLIFYTTTASSKWKYKSFFYHKPDTLTKFISSIIGTEYVPAYDDNKHSVFNNLNRERIADIVRADIRSVVYPNNIGIMINLHLLFVGHTITIYFLNRNKIDVLNTIIEHNNKVRRRLDENLNCGR